MWIGKYFYASNKANFSDNFFDIYQYFSNVFGDPLKFSLLFWHY